MILEDNGKGFWVPAELEASDLDDYQNDSFLRFMTRHKDAEALRRNDFYWEVLDAYRMQQRSGIGKGRFDYPVPTALPGLSSRRGELAPEVHGLIRAMKDVVRTY
ncbi:MAG: hypothetical protein ACWA5X_11605 [bacterium]